MALERAVDHVLTAEDVIIHKLIAWRPRDRDDIAAILDAGYHEHGHAFARQLRSELRQVTDVPVAELRRESPPRREHFSPNATIAAKSGQLFPI